MKEIKIVGFVSGSHYYDFVDACEDRGISLLGTYSQGEFKGVYEGTLENLKSATSAVGVFIG